MGWFSEEAALACSVYFGLAVVNPFLNDCNACHLCFFETGEPVLRSVSGNSSCLSFELNGVLR
jgi:hypothetical protein